MKSTVDTDRLNMEIFFMYIVQGLPFGFQSDVCPYLLRHWGHSYGAAGMVNLTFWPWILKPIAAPFLEGASDSTLTGCLASLFCIHLVLFLAVWNRDVTLLTAFLFCSNVCAAVSDIIIDKRAITSRIGQQEADVDLTNVMQVVGYKLGAAMSGSLVMTSAAAMVADPNVGMLLSPLLSAVGTAMLTARLFFGTHKSESAVVQQTAPSSINALRAILSHARQNLLLYTLLLVYKLGETIGDKLLKLFIQEKGVNLSGLAVLNSYSDMISIMGSCASLFFPRSKNNDRSNLVIVLCLNIFPQILRYFVVAFESFRNLYIIFIISAIEHFIGGSVTVALFNFMFSNTVIGIEGTHYSVYASLEVCGKLLAGSAALFLVPYWGFEVLFLVAVLSSFVPVGILLAYWPKNIIIISDEKLD